MEGWQYLCLLTENDQQNVNVELFVSTGKNTRFEHQTKLYEKAMRHTMPLVQAFHKFNQVLVESVGAVSIPVVAPPEEDQLE